MRQPNKIKELRKFRNLTQGQLADLINITPTHVSRLERGDRGLNADLIVKIAQALHVEPSDILGGSTPVVAPPAEPHQKPNDDLKDSQFQQQFLTKRPFDITSQELMLVELYRDMSPEQQQQWVLDGIMRKRRGGGGV